MEVASVRPVRHRALETEPDADASETGPAEAAHTDTDADTGPGCIVSGRVAVSVIGRLRSDAARNAERESQDAE